MASTSETVFSEITATKTDTTALSIRDYGAVALTVVGTGTAVGTAIVYGVDAAGNDVSVHTFTFTEDDNKGVNLTWCGYTSVKVHITAYTSGTFAAYLDAR
jgi:hypothetical protein